MGRPSTSNVVLIAKEYGVSRQKVGRIGVERLLAMSHEARQVMLGFKPMGITRDELHKGGLRARGFKVRGKSA